MIDRGAWIQTYTGRQFHYADPRIEEIHIEDIAHALSMLCRYAGHCNRFYSVAEHSVLVSRQFNSPMDRMIGLMHDATEAYCVDVPRPLKHMLPEYQDYEEKVWQVIAFKFGMPAKLPKSLHDMDTRVLLSERPQLFNNPVPWPKYDRIQLVPGLQVRGLEPFRARDEFLDEFAAIQRVL